LKNFITLIKILDETTKTNAKLKALVHYFQSAEEDDKIWALGLLYGRRPKKTISSFELKTWASEYALIPTWLFDESYHVVGDLAETIAHITAKEQNKHDFPLRYWMNILIGIDKKDEQQRKSKIFEAWQGFDFYNCFIFNKIITGGLRIGVSEKLVIKALATVHDLPENKVAYLLSGNWKPELTTYQNLLESNSREDISKPYPFFLAYPIENEIDTLGDSKLWQAEWKWDGIRGQIIKRQETCFIWSRGEELVTDKFPELDFGIQNLPNGTVLDGEIICWKNDIPLPFQNLQTRISRKNISQKILLENPVSFIAYDILEQNGIEIREKNLQERRTLLEKTIANLQNQHFIISEKIPFNDWRELTLKREQSREKGAEGLMLKKLDSEYETGRKKGTWWKWKIEPYTIDAVLLYAQKGHGRRADLFTDYTLALWDKEKLIPFAKAYSGLTDNELIEIDKFIKKNTLEKFGPVRSVKPHFVFEIAFEGINKSPRHKSGVAVRFPRIVRWRKDKPFEEANTLDDIKKLLASNGR
jgi:DNA ligase-1